MAAVTYYVALPFDRNEEGELVLGEAQECPTERAAIRRAEGAAAFDTRRKFAPPSAAMIKSSSLVPRSTPPR